MKQHVGILGVGAMGKPIAAHLLSEGYHVTLCGHRNHGPIDELVQLGAQRGVTPAEVAARSDVVLVLVPDTPEVEEVCFGDGRAVGVPLFETSLSAQLFTQARGLGYGRKDYSAVSLLYQDAADITIATGHPRRND
ncbi:MAG TPA: NAD(P)-binding domain-containing protein [Ktedonobacterales bacterium]|nr:NAD(P)-binding domain-containing protein [Ktedonobacterales bacterium]